MRSWRPKLSFVYHFKVQRLSQNQDDLYLAPGQVWDTRPSWQIDAHRLTLLDQVTEGKFATIYKATLKSSDKTLTVAAKVLKCMFVCMYASVRGIVYNSESNKDSSCCENKEFKLNIRKKPTHQLFIHPIKLLPLSSTPLYSHQTLTIWIHLW